MELLNHWTGELAALGAAMIWAGVSVYYVQIGKIISPISLNLSKNLVAIALLFLTILGLGIPIPAISHREFAILLLSGIVGITISDTAFLAALQDIGARRTLLLESTAPVFTTLISSFYLHEQLSLHTCMGVLLVVIGIVWVINERVVEIATSFKWRGIIFATIAALCHAVGGVLSREALNHSEISTVWSSLLRLIAGTSVLPIYLLGIGEVSIWLNKIKVRSILISIAIAAFFSTYLAIWLQQTALKYTSAGIALSLTATSPLFAIPIALFMGDRVSWQALFGVIVAIGGICLLFN